MLLAGFSQLHALVADRLVSAGVGLDLGAVDCHGPQLDQPHLPGQTHGLHEQVAQLLQVRRPEVADRAVLVKLPAPKTRNASSPCSLRSILRELNMPVA